MMDEQALRKQAKKRVAMKMGFLTHLLVFVLVNGGLMLINEGWGAGTRHWFVFPLSGWGLGLAIHGLVTLLSLQGQGLRQRMLEQEIERLRRQS